MKRTTLIITLVVIGITFLAQHGEARNISAEVAVRPSRCLDGDGCDSGAGPDGCSVSIKNCHSRGKCAFCSCSFAGGCACSCRTSGRSMEDGQLFHSLSDVVDLSFQGLTLEGLIAFFEEAPTGEWRFVSRINAPDTANAAPGLDRLTGHFDSASHDPNSIREVLDWFASQYGICVDANNGTKIVAFVNCRQ